jgi:hypothetical protein
LFECFAAHLHDEQATFLLYTLMTASEDFAASVVARSDLDRLVLPLLHNLYCSTQAPHARKPSGYRNVRQLYLIMIVMLKFSQECVARARAKRKASDEKGGADSSLLRPRRYAFGDDAFQRIKLASVTFYENRALKDVSLGSLIYLVLIRSVTANLNTMRDEYVERAQPAYIAIRVRRRSSPPRPPLPLALLLPLPLTLLLPLPFTLLLPLVQVPAQQQPRRPRQPTRPREADPPVHRHSPRELHG